MSEIPPSPRRPLGVLRGIFAAIGIIVMLLSGGCVVAFVAVHNSLIGEVVAIALVPFLVGLVIFLLATRAGRR